MTCSRIPGKSLATIVKPAHMASSTVIGMPSWSDNSTSTSCCANNGATWVISPAQVTLCKPSCSANATYCARKGPSPTKVAGNSWPNLSRTCASACNSKSWRLGDFIRATMIRCGMSCHVVSRGAFRCAMPFGITCTRSCAIGNWYANSRSCCETHTICVVQRAKARSARLAIWRRTQGTCGLKPKPWTV